MEYYPTGATIDSHEVDVIDEDSSNLDPSNKKSQNSNGSGKANKRPRQMKMRDHSSKATRESEVEPMISKPEGESDDIEALGVESSESMKNDKLKVVRLKTLTIGKDYEHQDRVGDWYPVTIIKEGPKPGEYVGQSIFQKKVTIERIQPESCVESAAPHQINWASYWFWVIFDLAFAGTIIFCVIYFGNKHNWSEKLEPYQGWLSHVGTWGIIPIMFIARIFWWFIFRDSGRAVKSVPKFVSRMIEIDGKQVHLVGSMHVSPGSVKDVQNVVDEVDPDVIMIELDYDRLASMKEDTDPQPVDQWLFKKEDGTSIRGVQTDWNASLNRHDISAPLTFDVDNVAGKILLAPFPTGNLSNFVYSAQKDGAKAVLLIDETQSNNDAGSDSENDSDYKPSRLFIGSSSCMNLWGHCFRFGRSKSPDIPCYLVPAAFTQADEGKVVGFKVRSSNISPPVSCKRHCCTVTCTTLTGIGVMYGLIRLAGVEAGGEFVLADKLADERGKVLATIDMGIGRLGAALCARLIPYPSNLWYAIVAWASVPRHLLTWFLFPQKHKLDLLLNMLWGFARFKCRTWLAFILGVAVSSMIITGLVYLITYLSQLGSSAAASAGGASDEDADEIGAIVAYTVGLSFQFFLYPIIYKGLLDSRDEQMYRGAVAQIRRRPNASKFVIVVGAAHTNGMMRRMYERGFMPNSSCREARRNWAPFPFNKGFLFNHLYYGWPANKDLNA